MTIIDLPTELWLRIAQFVPDADLFRLASVNRLFLDLVIDRRYRQLIIDDDSPTALLQKLSRIEQDPLVAKRVRSLTVHPKAIRSACLKSGKLNRRQQRSVRNQFWPETFRLRTERSSLEEDTDLADRFLDSLTNLSSIEEYIIEWKHGVDSERSFCLPLLSAIWPLHAATLRSIKLDMMLTHLSDMLPPGGVVPGLDRVQDLSLHFSYSDASRLAPAASWPLTAGGLSFASTQQRALGSLASFINSTSASLRSLRISSIGHLDFSTLYAHLTFFPQLVRLALLVPCDPRHVVDPTGFHSFLSMHRDIEHLSFSPQYCCPQSSLPPPEATHHHHTITNGNGHANGHLNGNGNINGNTSGANGTHLNGHTNGHTPNPPRTTPAWLHQAFNTLLFPSLLTLHLGLNILGSGGQRVLPPLPRIAAAARDVETLVVGGCIIALDDLRGLLEPFTALGVEGEEVGLGNTGGTGVGTRGTGAVQEGERGGARGPRRLVLEVHVLDLDLLELLEGALPGLHTLDLTYRWVGSSGQTNVAQFTSALQRRTFPAWTHLSTLILRCSRQDDHSRWPCQQAIVRCLPKRSPGPY